MGNNDSVRTPKDGDRRFQVYEEGAEATGGNVKHTGPRSIYLRAV